MTFPFLIQRKLICNAVDHMSTVTLLLSRSNSGSGMVTCPVTFRIESSGYFVLFVPNQTAANSIRLPAWSANIKIECRKIHFHLDKLATIFSRLWIVRVTNPKMQPPIFRDRGEQFSNCWLITSCWIIDLFYLNPFRRKRFDKWSSSP